MGVTGRRFARGVGVLFVLPAAVGGLLGLGIIASGFSTQVGVGASTDPLHLGGPRLKPIAIPARACPSLNVVRAASDAAEEFWVAPDRFENLGTPASDQRLDALLAPLERSARAAATQVPTRLRDELSDLAHQVEIGRALIAYRQTQAAPFINALLAGVTSLDNASDLVGHACGLPLAT